MPVGQSCAAIVAETVFDTRARVKIPQNASGDFKIRNRDAEPGHRGRRRKNTRRSAGNPSMSPAFIAVQAAFLIQSLYWRCAKNHAKRPGRLNIIYYFSKLRG
jgi:hypothetical protein